MSSPKSITIGYVDVSPKRLKISIDKSAKKKVKAIKEHEVKMMDEPHLSNCCITCEYMLEHTEQTVICGERLDLIPTVYVCGLYKRKEV